MSQRSVPPPQYGPEHGGPHPWGAEYEAEPWLDGPAEAGDPRPDWNGGQPEWRYLDGRSADPLPRDDFAAMRTRRTSRKFPRGLAIAAVAVGVGVVAVIALVGQGRPGGHPAGGSRGTATAAASSSAVPPVITRAQAQQVLARFVAVSNAANKSRSDAQLASIEDRTSYRMDIGAYRWTRVTDPGNRNYAPFSERDPVYYIPRLSGYPRWWAVQVTYMSPATAKAAPTRGYLIFSQNAAGASWKNVLEPDILGGTGPAPQIATDAQGYAIATTSSTRGLSIAPGQIQAVTAASLDGTSGALTGPRNLSDQSDEAFWRSRLKGGTDTDTHSAAPAGLVGLRTSNGGALLFYALTAHLTLQPPSGESMHIQIPGYYSTAQTVTVARVGYTEQFATYDPLPGQGTPRIVADNSDIDSRG